MCACIKFVCTTSLLHRLEFCTYTCTYKPAQVRDEFRMDYDPGRGGFGKILQLEAIKQSKQMMMGGECLFSGPCNLSLDQANEAGPGVAEVYRLGKESCSGDKTTCHSFVAGQWCSWSMVN